MSLEKDEVVFDRLATLRGKTAGCDGKRAEVWSVESPIKRAGEGSVGKDNEIVLGYLVIELLDGFCP